MPSRALTTWYARTFLRSLSHLDPWTVHRVNGLYVPGGSGDEVGFSGRGGGAGRGGEPGVERFGGAAEGAGFVEAGGEGAAEGAVGVPGTRRVGGSSGDTGVGVDVGAAPGAASVAAGGSGASAPAGPCAAACDVPVGSPVGGSGGSSAGDGDEIRLVVVGDSTALGVGVACAHQAPGALLGQWLAEETGRAVRVWVHGRFGATTRSLAGRVERAARVRPDLVVVLSGANDSLLPVPLGVAARALGRHVRRLVGEGAAVVAAVSPDAGCGDAIPGFLGRLLSLRCRRLGRLQARHALRAGARVVSFRDDDFRTRRARLIADDGFHPSALGYELHAGRLMHAMLASLAGPRLPAVHAALCLRRADSLRSASRRLARTPNSHAAPSTSPGVYDVQVLPPKRRRPGRTPPLTPPAPRSGPEGAVAVASGGGVGDGGF
ncbi:GDSL-type esterase/lipase family protein [Streptomyces sp. NPDC004539]|uniref:GDSL-type esterase/lipase family protein n=1 Tax=Streptomyces sp. NPDC004539 TaxID=3154280 RepID=UPI0033B0DB11